MITDDIIESIVNCKYKVYLKFNEKKGTKKDYELMQDELLESCKNKYIKNIKLRHENDQLLYNFQFENNSRFRNISFVILPRIKTEKYNITFDFIKIIPSKFSDGGRSFVPILVSPKENFSKIDKLILCIKSIILSEVYNINCEHARIVYGDELKTIKFKMEKLLVEAKRLIDELNNTINNASEPLICQKNHCKVCEFQNECYKKLQEEDSLALFRRLDETEIRKYNNKGIFTVKQLSYTFKPRKRNRRIKDVISPYYLSLQALAIRENKVYVHDKIDIPESIVKVFIDMEGNSAGSSIYLIGIIIDNGGQETTYSLWADNKEQEIEIFRRFVDILKELDKPQIYYYGRYETKVFRRIISLFNEDSLKELLEKKSTNILKIIYRKIYFPTYSNSLKEVARFFGCNWSRISNAIESVVLRNKWGKSNDFKIKEMLIDYNMEDCIALKKIVEFLCRVRNITNQENQTNGLKDVGFVEDMKPSQDEKKTFKDMECATKDIEIITKSAYFEYQRSKIYWRTNKRIKKIIFRKPRKKLEYKPNKIIQIKAKKCPKCKSKNICCKGDRSYCKICLDLKLTPSGVRRWIPKYYTFVYICQDCKKEFIPSTFLKIQVYSKRNLIPKNYIKKEHQVYGHNLLAWIVYQSVINRISMRSLEKNLMDYFGLYVDYWNIWNLRIIATRYYKETYNKIFRNILNGHLIHIDESKVKLKKESGYVWAFTNMEEVYYVYKPNREADFLDDLLQEFNGVIVTDFYAGYDSLECSKQRCLVHLIRDLNDTLLKNLHNDEVKEMVVDFGKILREIIETTDKYGLKGRFMQKHKKPIKKFFAKLKKTRMDSEVAEKIQKRLIKYENELFTFLDHDGIPWNNNNVEYSIKIVKTYVRRIEGTITKGGLETQLILLSIYQTCKYKGINFLDFLLSGKKDIDEFEASLKK